MSDTESKKEQAEVLWEKIKAEQQSRDSSVNPSGDELANEATAIWEAFCEQLKLAGPVLMRTSNSELNLAEGLRHLVRQIRMGFEISCEYADTQHPQIVPAYTPTMVSEGPTSDCRYFHARINGSNTYRVKGKLGTAPFFEFSTYSGKIGFQDVSAQVASITEDELVTEEDGSFEFIVSPKEQSGNWLKTNEATDYLYFRQYAHDWSNTELTQFEIECVDAKDPESLTLDNMRNALELTSKFVAKAPGYWSALVDGISSNPNTVFIVPADIGDKPTMPVGHQFAFGSFKLEQDEALVLEFQASDIPFWAVQLTNSWFEPLDFDQYRSRINNKFALVGDDGKARIVIANKNALLDLQQELPINLVDTLDHQDGTLVFRWSRTFEPVPEMTTNVVKFSDL